ncbi:hypothetical protein [Flavobacterium luteum]|uniref:Uncharacterized protein n=1 Tax=Flavobacterium luteum TaxID=2026654 RepID=A0A7J5AKJ7_9FLAO|nr:hypothetical protein [Flavobacterium luteum]KAB1157958.1 hypothetical protein F6464_02420 [Flavobacterium luteum]
MKESDYLDNIGNDKHSNDQIVEAIINRVVSFKKLQETGEFDHSRQKKIKALLNEKYDVAFSAANSISELQNYLEDFPEGNHITEVNTKIKEIQAEINRTKKEQEERDRMLREIKHSINENTIDEIIDKLSDSDLYNLCNDLEIDFQIIKNFKEPPITFNAIPKKENEVPQGYTDVFFWGIPSSGKTCALSAILSTIKNDYSMEAPDCDIKFGATYRTSLVNIFNTEIGYLPPRTNEDRTQYMPFLFYKRGEKNKRRISFFELSGEVFKSFYEKVNDTKIILDKDRDGIEQSFKTLELLLNSSNQKIHFFFIDYNQETKNSIDIETGLTQYDYLEAATTYFRDNNDIFKKKTDAVYVVVTKSDEIQADNNKQRAEKAKLFLEENFGNFMDVLSNQCNRNSVHLEVKLFSIGKVYFKRICKINRASSINIINDLLDRVKPISNNRFKDFFNR